MLSSRRKIRSTLVGWGTAEWWTTAPIYVTDRKSGNQYLVDMKTEVSVISVSLLSKNKKLCLYQICTYNIEKLILLNLKSRRLYIWLFNVTDEKQ